MSVIDDHRIWEGPVSLFVARTVLTLVGLGIAGVVIYSMLFNAEVRQLCLLLISGVSVIMVLSWALARCASEGYEESGTTEEDPQ